MTTFPFALKILPITFHILNIFLKNQPKPLFLRITSFVKSYTNFDSGMYPKESQLFIWNLAHLLDC